MLIVTIAALVMAASLGWFAYRLMQEEQRRSDARVALLTAALQDGQGELDPFARSGPVGFSPVSLPSIPVAPPARSTPSDSPELVYLDDDSGSVVRFRSERVADDIAGMDTVDAGEPLLVTRAPVTPPSGEVETRSAGLFADVPEARPADARGAIALVGVVLVAALALGYVWFGRPATVEETAVATRPAATTAAAAVPGGIPLELVSLTHEQRGNSLIVRGVVRNPVSGSDRAGVAASVMLLDQAGGFLGSGRAPVATTRLSPGDSTGFAVELPSHKDVRRYRVTFRGVDGSLVPHADKRK
jgi:hypothetical protein